MNLCEVRVLAVVEARERLGPLLPETLEGFKRLVEAQKTVELLEMMKAVAFRGWDKS